jgi:SAM-dependent methyltransferase
MTASRYTLDNTWDKAHRRLAALERANDHLTVSQLEGLGVARGWECLELGAGAGSIARWLADVVGPTGSVTAADIEPRFLEAQPHPGVEVLRHDLIADGVPGAGWDLIHCRMLLMHLPNREALLSAIVSSLRPGGIALVEEADTFPTATAASTLYSRFWEQVVAVAEKAGGDWAWARSLPTRFAAAGAHDVRVRCDVPYFRAGEPWAEAIDLTAEQLEPALLTAGSDPEFLAAARAEMADPTKFFPMFAMVSVSGRRPG